MKTDELLDLKPADFEMILEGLEALKSKDLAGEMMGELFESIISKKPGEMTEEEKAKAERRQIEKEQERRIREDKKKKMKQEIDLLKAKITLIVRLNQNDEPRGLLQD